MFRKGLSDVLQNLLGAIIGNKGCFKIEKNTSICLSKMLLQCGRNGICIINSIPRKWQLKRFGSLARIVLQGGVTCARCRTK